MNPLKNFRSEAEFEQTALKQFYDSLETTWLQEKNATRFGDLLEVFEAYHHEMQWDPSLRPYLQDKLATELFTHTESQKKAVALWEKALNDQHCLEFLRVRIIYSQANSHRSGQGHSKPRIATAYSYYNWVVGQSYAGTALKQQAKLDMANMLRIGHAELQRDRGKARELYGELLKTLKANDPLLPEVYYGLATCYQDGLDSVTKDVVTALHYWILLFQVGCPKKLLERALKHKDACEMALKAEIKQLQSAKETHQQALLDLEREKRDMQSEKVSTERALARADEIADENSRLAKELEKERLQSQKRQGQIEKDASAVKQLKAQVQALTEQRDTLGREHAEFNTNLRAEQVENRRLKTALAQAQETEAERKKLAEENALLEKELESESQLSKEYINQIKKDASEIEQLKTVVQALTKQRDTLSREHEEIKTEKNKLAEEKALITKELEKERLQIQEHIDQIKNFASEIEQLRAEMQALTKQRDTLLNSSLQSDQSEEIRQKSELARVDELEAERKKLAEENALLLAAKDNEILKDMDRIGGYVTEIEQLEVQVRTLTQQLTATNWAYAELNTNLRSEQNENKRLKSVLDTSQQQFATSQQKLAIALEHIKKSKETAIDPKEHEQIKKQLSNLEVANRQLKDEIADYEWQLEEAQKDIQPIHNVQKASIDSFKAELIALKQMVTTLKEQTSSDLLTLQKAAKEEHETSVKELDLLKGYIVLLQNREKEAKEPEDDLTTSALRDQNSALVAECNAMKERAQRLVALQNALEQLRKEEQAAYTAVTDRLLSEKASLENENRTLKANLARAMRLAGVVERDESTQ